MMLFQLPGSPTSLDKTTRRYFLWFQIYHGLLAHDLQEETFTKLDQELFIQRGQRASKNEDQSFVTPTNMVP